MYSMWNAPSDRDYYGSLGAGCPYEDEDDVETCPCCGARWDLEEVCEEWCETNEAADEPAPGLPSVSEEPELPFLLTSVENAGWIALLALSEVEDHG